MGVRLMVEVLDQAPPELTASERLLLIALAEKADDRTRRVIWSRADHPREVLCRRLGVKDATLTAVLRKLAARGLDPRVPIAEDRNGRAVYAFEGKATEYRVPALVTDLLGNPLDVERVDQHQPSEGGRASTLTSTSVHPLEPERVDEHQPLVPPVPQSPAARERRAVAEQLVAQHAGALDLAEAEAIATAIDEARHPTSLAAYVSRIPLDELRRSAPRRPAPSGAAEAKCPHGRPGGLKIHGAGTNRSRVCTPCELEHPADQAERRAG